MQAVGCAAAVLVVLLGPALLLPLLRHLCEWCLLPHSHSFHRGGGLLHACKQSGQIGGNVGMRCLLPPSKQMTPQAQHAAFAHTVSACVLLAGPAHCSTALSRCKQVRALACRLPTGSLHG